MSKLLFANSFNLDLLINSFMKQTILLFLVFVSANVFAQDFKTSDNTLISLSVKIDDGWIDKLSNDQKLYLDQSKESYKYNKFIMQERMDTTTLAKVYEAITSKGIPLKDKDALQDFMTYNDNGIPSSAIPKTIIKKVIKKGYETDYYFSVNLMYTLGVGSMVKGLPGQVKPEMKCTIKVFDKEREVVKKAEGKFKLKKAIKRSDFPGRSFSKISERNISLLAKKLQPVIDGAIDAAIKKM